MKRAITFFAVLLMVTALSLNSYAIKKRVNNTPGVNADYSTFLAAYNAAGSGDTLYLEGTAITYVPPDTIKKKLVIIGPGYFLALNSETQASTAPAYIDYLTFGKGSDGSVLTGVYVKVDMVLDASNLIIMRNYVGRYLQIVNNYKAATNILIKQNFITYLYQNNSTKPASSVAILNNYIYQLSFTNTSSTVIFANNTVYYPVNMENSEFYNNILTHPANTMAGANNHIYNNIYVCAGTDYNGNLFNKLVADIFVPSGSTDGQYQLKVGSPAIGAGSLNVDCGMFGGTEPYVLSGIPALPHIWDAKIENTGSAGTGLPVQLKAKSQN